MVRLPRPTPPRKSLLSVGQYLRSGQRRRLAGAILVLFVGTALVIADRQGWLLTKAPEWTRYEGKTFRVVRVIDGDTLDVDAPDDEHPTTRIRFWGIDAPETAKPREGTPAEPFADDAWVFTRKMCEGKSVTLKLDAHQVRDRYGRLLAYIVLPDGAMLNEKLLLEGLCRFEGRFPHQHLERFELLEKQAKFDRKGMWRK